MFQGLQDNQLKGAIEAMLFVTDEPVGTIALADMLEVEPADVEQALVGLRARFEAEERGVQLREVAGGWRLYTHPVYHELVEKYVLSWDTRKLSQAAMETLAIVAYSQPVTRAGVASVRGVNSDSSLNSLVEKGLVAGSISLYVGYAKGRGAGGGAGAQGGGIAGDDGRVGGVAGDDGTGGEYFDGGHGRRPASGRRAFPHTGGTRRQPDRTNLCSRLMPRFLDLFDETTRKDAPIRRINVGFGGVLPEEFATMDLFADAEAEAEERRLQQAVLAVKGRFGKNALLRGTSLKEKATARERNEQIGGHHA